MSTLGTTPASPTTATKQLSIGLASHSSNTTGWILLGLSVLVVAAAWLAKSVLSIKEAKGQQ